MVQNIGIDLSIKAKSHAQIRDEKGKKVTKNYSFYLNRESLDNLCSLAKGDNPENIKLRFIFEATGMAWLPLALYGKTHGYEVVRVKPQKACDLRKYFSRYRKDDSLDAKTLSLMPVIDKEAMQEVYLPNAKIFSLNRRCKQRERMVGHLTAIKNRLGAFLDWVFPGIMDCFRDPFGEAAKMFYRFYLNPFKTQKMSPEELVESLTTQSGERVKVETAQAILKTAKQVSRLYEGTEAYLDFEECQKEILPEIEILEAYQTQLREIELEIAEIYEEVHPSKEIETLKGMGEKLGPSILSLIGTPERFSNEKKLRAYLGLIPRQKESGSYEKKGLPMTQAGPSRGRRDFYLTAEVARQWDPQLAKVYYNEMVHKRNCHTQAVCAVAVRLVARVLRILKDKRSYELRDIDGRRVSVKEAREIIKTRYTVPEEIRERMRNRKKRGRRSGYSKRLSRIIRTPHNRMPSPFNDIRKRG